MKTPNKPMQKKLVKGLLVLVMLSMLISPFMMFGLNSDAEETYSTEIMKVKGGRDAVATFTFDDGYYSNDSKLVGIFGDYGLPVSFMVVPDRILGTPPYSSGYSNVAQLKEMINTGYVSIENHSYSHIYMTGSFASNATEENYQREIIESKNFLESNFPGLQSITFAIPGGSNYTEDAMKLVMQTYYAARAGGSASVSAMQSLTPSDDATLGGWYKLRTIWLQNAAFDNINSYHHGSSVSIN